MLLALQDSKPIIVTIVQTPARHTTFLDVVLASLGITGAAILVAVVLGVVLAFGLVIWNRRHPPQLGHLPPISPLVPDRTASPSSPTR